VIGAQPVALVVLPGSLLWKLVLVLAGSALTALAAQVPDPAPVQSGAGDGTDVRGAPCRGVARPAWPVVPFIPGDLVKMALAALALPGAWRLVRP
jgi:hypothetical protein